MCADRVRSFHMVCYLYFISLAHVNISPNPNIFNFWTSESEYIKKLESEYIFFKIEGIRESWNCDMMRIHLFGQNPYESIYGLESEYISFFAIECEYNYPVRDMDLSPISDFKSEIWALFERSSTLNLNLLKSLGGRRAS